MHQITERVSFYFEKERRGTTVECLCGSDLVAEEEGEAPDAIVEEPDRNRGECGFAGSGSAGEEELNPKEGYLRFLFNFFYLSSWSD